MARRYPLGSSIALGDLACNVGDDSCKRVFDSGMDVRKPSSKSDTASELLGGFPLLALTLCCDIANVLVASFLAKPAGLSAHIRSDP